MIHQLKKQIIYLLPNFILDKLFFLKQQIHYQRVREKYNSTRKIFESAQPEPNPLSISDLQKFQKNYTYHPEYGYSLEIVDKRGRERAGQLISSIKNKSYTTYLELGCWDGMVTFHLQKLGKIACGIDNRAIGFDQRAINQRTDLRMMDASNMKFEDHSFDVVFSYDSFEHFSDPASVLQEIYRVTKPGGYIFLEFGPLFMSPMGLHAYRQITVPYCQHLFSEKTLSDFLVEENLEPLDFTHCNGWSLIQFRELFDLYSGKLQKEIYVETSNYNHLPLIEKYAPIIKSKTDNFDNLICDSIKVLFKKK
jgi:SAM-dependent methyltransferase